MSRVRFTILLAALTLLVAASIATLPSWTAQPDPVEIAEAVPYSQGEDVVWTPKPPRSALSGRWEYFWHQRAYPLDAIPAGARLAALEHDRTMNRNVGAAFTEKGPKGFTSTIEPTWGQMSGRARALLIDPDTAGRMFIGTATGGVWSTTDTGATWTALTDSLDSLSIGALAWDLTDTTENTFFVGTGEGPAGFYYGAGIFRTTDGGSSFTKLAGSTVFEQLAIADLQVDPANAMNIVVCVTTGSHTPGPSVPDNGNTGVWRSTNGGTSFTQVVNTHFCESLRPTPGDFSTQYASLTGVLDATDGLYKSTDGGANWSQLTLPNAQHKRLEVGIGSGSAANRETIYVGGKDSGDTTRLYKSTNAGTSFSTLSQDYCTSQCFYDNFIEVSPANPDIAYFGGVQLFRSLDGGSTFDQPGLTNGGPVHVDHHLGAFDPNDGTGATFLLLNDGGIYRTTDAASATGGPSQRLPTWSSISNNLASLQHYDMDLHPTDPDIIITGNQDNGTLLRTASDVFVEYCGGDGGYALIDKSTPATMYCSFAFSGGTFSIQKTLNSGADAFGTDVSFAAGADTGEFIPPIIMDPNTSTTLFAGTSRVWKTTNGGSSWTPASLSGGTGNVTGLTVAPSNSMHVWAVTSEGRVEQSTDGGTTWSNRTTASLPGRYATSVAVSPTDTSTVYVGYSGFSAATPAGHVFKTTDGGTTWANSGTTRVPSSLPDIPVNSIAINPNNANHIFVGTDVGLYLSLTAGADWEKFANVPNVAVTRVKASSGSNILGVGTNGRGTFTAPLNTVPVELQKFTVD